MTPMCAVCGSCGADPHAGQAHDGSVGRHRCRLERGEPDPDPAVLRLAHPLGRPVAVPQAEIALRDQAHHAAQRSTEAHQELVRAPIPPADDAIATGRGDDLRLEGGPAGLRGRELHRLDPFAVRLEVATGLREEGVTGSGAGREVHVGQHPLASGGPRSALDLRQDRRTDTAPAMAGMGHHVGVADGGVVLEREVEQADPHGVAVVERSEELEVEPRRCARERTAGGLPRGDQVAASVGLGGAPHVVPLAQLRLVLRVDVPDHRHGART